MKTFLKILVVLGLLTFFFFGMFLMIDIGQIMSTHIWFEGTKMEGQTAIFVFIWLFGLMSIVLAAMVMLLNPNLWKKIKELDKLSIDYQDRINLYEKAKNDLALEAFGYAQRQKALHNKIVEYKEKIKELENGHTTKTD